MLPTFQQGVWHKGFGSNRARLEESFARIKFAQGWYKRGVANNVCMPVHTHTPPPYILVYYISTHGHIYTIYFSKGKYFFDTGFRLGTFYIQGLLVS